MTGSIKFKLVAWLVAVTCAAFGALGFALYYQLKDIAVGSLDSHLHSEVQLVAGLMEVEDGRLDVELSEVAVGDYALPLSGHYYQVLSEGRVVARSPSLALVDAIIPYRDTPEGFSNITGPGKKPLRLNQETFAIGERTVMVQAAESLAETYALIDSFKRTLLVFVPVVSVVFALGGVFIINLSLRGLDRFGRKIETITEKNLNERLDTEGLATELKPLAGSFNTVLGRLEESFEKQRSFLSDASHQLRTPTTLIKSWSDHALSKRRTEDEYREALEKVKAGATRMSAIIDKILESAKLESELLSMESAPLDLAGVLSDVTRLLKDAAVERSVEVRLPGSAPTVAGDRERLIELFTNIVENAIKYNRPGGAVEIEAAAEGGEAVVRITDTGGGIPEKDLERIFSRFYRSDDTAPGTAGSGLGLSIARGIAEAHGGSITAESKTGEGSTFTVRLPLERT